MSNAVTYNQQRPYTRALWRLIQTMAGTTPDGIPGELTAAAVTSWQTENDETPDGKCGPDTLHAMGLGLFTFHDDGFSWTGKMSICADGAPTAYRPDDTGIDALANAGWPRRKYGLAKDANGVPYRQGPEQQCPNGYVSTTAMNLPGYGEHDQRRYVDATRIPYLVLPRNIGDLLPARLRKPLEKGDVVSIVRNHPTIHVPGDEHRSEIDGIYAEVGPSLSLDTSTVYGEASVKAAIALGHNPYQHLHGVWRARVGISKPIIEYRVYVGTSNKARVVTFSYGQELCT